MSVHGVTWGLIRGRHEMPVTGYLVEAEHVSADPHFAARLRDLVYEGMVRLSTHDGMHTILITGLTTAAMYAVLFAREHTEMYPDGIVFAAYDRDSDGYVGVMYIPGRKM